MLVDVSAAPVADVVVDLVPGSAVDGGAVVAAALLPHTGVVVGVSLMSVAASGTDVVIGVGWAAGRVVAHGTDGGLVVLLPEAKGTVVDGVPQPASAATSRAAATAPSLDTDLISLLFGEKDNGRASKHRVPTREVRVGTLPDMGLIGSVRRDLGSVRGVWWSCASRTAVYRPFVVKVESWVSSCSDPQAIRWLADRTCGRRSARMQASRHVKRR